MNNVVAPARATGFSEAHERIIDASYRLFATRSVRDVAMDEVVARSGVAKATLYRHFPTKDDLVLAFLARREEAWTYGMVEAGARSLSDSAEGRLFAIFDVLDEWFHRADFEACSFMNILLEMGSDHPLGRACAQHIENLRCLLAGMAADAGLAAPEEFARSWHMLMAGAIVQAAGGDLGAARRARSLGALLVADERRRG
jgi:AcrR family transcriptional regulator